MNLAYPPPFPFVLKCTLVALLVGGSACADKKTSSMKADPIAEDAESDGGASGQSTPPLAGSADNMDATGPMPTDDTDRATMMMDAGSPDPEPEVEEELPSGVVAQATFEGNGLVDGWELDLSIGSDSSAHSIRPPEVAAGESAKFAFSCDLKSHTMLKFAYWGDRPTPAQQLKLYIDSVLYEAYGNTHWGEGRSWHEAAVAVPPGPHTYVFEAVTDVAGRPPFRLDSLRCVEATPESATGDQINLDHPYYSPDVAGDWQINNDRAHSAEDGYGLSAQPPLLDGPGSASLEFNCAGRVHSQLTFWYLGHQPGGGQPLRLYVDDQLYQEYGNTDWAGELQWYEVKIVVANATHRYRFEANTDVAGRPPYRLDSFNCTNVEPQPNLDGVFELDGSFIPTEISGFWQLNNGQAQTPGGMSAEAPVLPAGGQATLTLDCSAVAHQTLRFWYWGNQPTPDQTLELFIDGLPHSSYGNTNWAGDLRWYEASISVPEGAHRYEWVATTATAGRPPFRLDSLRCE